MLNWLKRWGFERTRLIFQFFDGRQSRRVDPLAVWFALHADPELILDEHQTLMQAAPEDDGKMLQEGRVQAWEITGRAVGRAFGIPDGQLTLLERQHLLVVFLNYLHELKKNINWLPIWLPPTVLPSSARSTTKPASDSTSTVPAPKPAAPAV